MPNALRRPGATLVDLVASIALLSVVMGMAVPRLVMARDERAAHVARDAVAAAIAEARTLAVARGSARLLLDPVTTRIQLEAPAGVRAADAIDLRATFGVTLAVDRAAGVVALDFDGLGLGRMVNRTVRVRRGAAEARLSLSAYGRPRRW